MVDTSFFMKLCLLLVLISSCGTMVSENKSNVLEMEYFEDGNIKKMVTFDGVNKGDSTVTFFYNNGVVAKVVNYKNGLIYPGQVSFNKSGGAFIVRQFIHLEDTTMPNQSYVFDEHQNIRPEVSNFAIIDQQVDTCYKVQYITSFNQSDFLIVIIDSLYKNRLHAKEEWILNDTFKLQPHIFTYRPNADIRIGFSYLTANRDSSSWPFIR